MLWELLENPLHTSSQARQLNDCIILWASLPLKKFTALYFIPVNCDFGVAPEASKATFGGVHRQIPQFIGTQGSPTTVSVTKETAWNYNHHIVTLVFHSLSLALGGQMIPLLFLFLSDLILL